MTKGTKWGFQTKKREREEKKLTKNKDGGGGTDGGRKGTVGELMRVESEDRKELLLPQREL